MVFLKPALSVMAIFALFSSTPLISAKEHDGIVDEIAATIVDVATKDLLNKSPNEIAKQLPETVKKLKGPLESKFQGLENKYTHNTAVALIKEAAEAKRQDKEKKSLQPRGAKSTIAIAVGAELLGRAVDYVANKFS